MAHCDRCQTFIPVHAIVNVRIGRGQNDESPMFYNMCDACGLELITWINRTSRQITPYPED